MWQKSMMALMVACSLTACRGGELDDVLHLVKSVTQLIKLGTSNQNDSTDKPQPTLIQAKAPEGLMITPPNYAAEILQANAKSYRSPIKYKAVKPQHILYFDKNGKLVSNQKEAFYSRQFLGKTAQGNWVAQDFYVNNASPQTAPFMLRLDANAQSFDSSMIEGLLLNFKENGDLDLVAEFHDGKLFGVQSYYENNQLVAQASDENDGTLWLLYPDGTVKTIIQSTQITVFRNDGSALSQITTVGDKGNVALWYPDGRSVTENDKQADVFNKESQAIMQEVLPLVKRLQNQNMN